MNALACATIAQTKKAKKHLWESKDVGAELQRKINLVHTTEGE